VQPHDVGAVLVAAGLLIQGTARADEPARPSGLMTFPGVRVERATPRATASSTAEGVAARVYVDPTTGRVRERTPEDAAAEAAASRESPRPAATPQVVQGPDGIVGVRLDAKAAVYSVVTRTDDGRLVGRCVDDPAHATTGTVTSPVRPAASAAEPLPAGADSSAREDAVHDR
jgi:hypothetical protein